ncbi:MAG: flavin reductase [Erysipelotrichaceae bacterium]
MNERALFKLSYGLYIVSSKDEYTTSGCIVNSLNQITNTPNQMSVTLNKNNATTKVIQNSNMFTAVVLTQSAPMELIGEFGFKSSKDVDKFSKFKVAYDHDIPYINEHVAAYFTCKVTQSVDVGTHIMFIGECIEAEEISKEEVMTYAYYHQVKNGTTPPSAPSYQKEVKVVGWRCKVCGYIYEGEHIPADFICPVCGVDVNSFEKIEG